MSLFADALMMNSSEPLKCRKPDLSPSPARPLRLTFGISTFLRNSLPPEDSSRRDPDDVELMARSQWGDADAFGQVMERYWEHTYRYARHLLGDPDRAYDVAQEAFTRLWQKRDEWEPSGSIEGWLLRTARNLVITEQRRGKVRMRWRSMIGREMQSHPRTPLQEMEIEELRVAIQRAVQELPPRRREVFILFHLHHLSYREIEETLNIRHQTIANHLQVAIAELRSALAPFITSGKGAIGPRGSSEDDLESTL